MSAINRAKEMGETLGFAKLLVDGDTDQILGAAILGPGGDEIINMFAAYMYSGLPCSSYRKSVLVHPTVSRTHALDAGHAGAGLNPPLPPTAAEVSGGAV